MHSVLVRQLTDPLLHWHAGSRVRDVLAEMEQSQWYPSERLRELQWTRLRTLLHHASTTVPYYRALFQELGARLEDFRGLDDLERLPVLTRAVVQARTPELRADGAGPLFPRVTSGSTGIPLRTAIDAPSRDALLAAVRRSRRWWGREVGDRSVRLSTSLPSRRQRWRSALLNQHLLSCGDLSDDALLRLWRRIIRLRPVSLRGNPEVLSRLARVAREQGGAQGVGLRTVVCTAETLYPHQRALLAETFGCAVVNHYGANEVGLVAAECPAGRMHITAENVLVEARPVALEEGGWTELVVTDLTNWGMPLIRYVVGDLGAPVEGACPCGRGLPLLNLRAGRTGELVALPGGRYLDHSVLCPIFEDIGGNQVRQYRIIQEALDRFTVLIAGESKAEVAEAVRGGFRRTLPTTHVVDVRFVDQILPERSGKLRLFLSRIGAPAPERTVEEIGRGAPVLPTPTADGSGVGR